MLNNQAKKDVSAEAIAIVESATEQLEKLKESNRRDKKPSSPLRNSLIFKSIRSFLKKL